MSINKSIGNMYDFITHTWNTVKGECYHNCSYCYMKRWGKLRPVRFDEKELKTDLGKDNFIFVGSSCDMWAQNINQDWIARTLICCDTFKNEYFFQSKNPFRMIQNYDLLPHRSSLCTTLETNRFYPEIMGNSPKPEDRLFSQLHYVTIEPIIDFDIDEFILMIKKIMPFQVNIGADSGRNNLPEPSKERVLNLISELEKFTIIHKKTNLKRLL